MSVESVKAEATELYKEGKWAPPNATRAESARLPVPTAPRHPPARALHPRHPQRLLR